MPRVGVFGGSFNPIHFGHLLLADDICEALRLDRILFVPAAQPPHKPAAELGLGAFGAPDGPILHRAASLPISGSDLRRRAREGRSLAYRMPEAVAAYIRAHGLYGPGA